jgi:penicillin amidase
MLIVRRAVRVLASLIALVLVAVAIYAANVAIGYGSKARVEGTIAHLGIRSPVQILRDERGVPHIRAQNEHDLFFAQGYAEGQDRLFQLDLLRRYVYGRLSEVLGSAVLGVDENSRIVPVHDIVRKQWAKLSSHEHMLLTAFADGVNAAAEREPTPVEFRALGYHMERWQPQDSLAVGFATVLDLTDTWNDIARRSGNEPISEPCFDAPVMAGLSGIANPKTCHPQQTAAELLRAFSDPRPPIGSNEWASGASHTSTGRALLANDPHLSLQIPGVWYLVDLQAPGYHAAGATLAGTPGVILGHNDRIAWGATNGTVASMSAFDEPADRDGMRAVTETFHVRFGDDVTRTYYRSDREFEAPISAVVPTHVVVRWPAYSDPISPLPAFDALDRATSIEDGVRALRSYPGPTQNFALADVSGRAAYHLAGDVPNDPLWATRFHPSSDLQTNYPNIPFAALPAVAPSRDAIVWTSNNKMYGRGYPLRLSAEFAPPCRAFRVATLLRAKPKYDVAYFSTMQMDVRSPCELAFARSVPQLEAWNGDISSDSTLATQAIALRIAFTQRFNGMNRGLLAAPAHAAILRDLFQQEKPALPWGEAGRITVDHPLASLGFRFLNGTSFDGNGDSYTIHVQSSGFSQSFRAVWDIGNWDAGGISIPQGESGRPGSGHYTDEAAAWTAGRLTSLPYSNAAVDRATATRLTLSP